MSGLFLAASVGPTFGQAALPRSRRVAAAEPAPAPDRLVITAADAPSPSPAAPSQAARTPMARDAYGNLRRADEPRFVTGSFIPQKFALHDNEADTATPVSIFSAGDLRKNPPYGGLFHGQSFGASYSDMEFVRRQQVRAASPPATGGPVVHVVDLRGVAPEKRRAALVKLLGAKRADQAIAETRALQQGGSGQKSR